MPISRIPVVPKDPMLEAPAGRTGQSTVNKFGASASVADGTTEEIWDGAVSYTWPTSASITHLWSAVDSATTRSVTVEIQGLDTNWSQVTQTVDTDATDSTTEVVLGTALRRVFRMKILDADTMDQAIRVGPTGKASFQAEIGIGNNQTLMAIYTVPAGKTAYITQYYGSIIGEAGPPQTLPDYVLFRMWHRDNANGYAPQLKHEIGSVRLGSSLIPPHDFKPYLKVDEKTDIYLTAFADGDDAYVSAGFDLILEDN